MAEIVNLNRARKAKARTERAGEAAANRAAFGLTKAQKAEGKALKAKAETALDGHKREP